MLGSFDPLFLRLPQEVISTSLKVHQKCFPLVTENTNQLAPYFIAVSDALCPGDSVVQGYEKVIAARLTDALFFWDQDLKRPLSQYAHGLKNRIFFEGLGSVYQKTQRIQKAGCQWLSMMGKDALIESFTRAAEVMKVDLATSMVGEFPSLQGIMGCYYAKEQGWPQDQAIALKEQYTFGRGHPVISQEELCVGGALAMAEAMDSLVGFFALGYQPSGSKDPMALKRSAAVVIKGCLACGLDFQLSSAVDFFYEQYQQQGFLKDSNRPSTLIDFFADRLAYILSEIGIPSVFIQAVMFRGLYHLGKEESLWNLAYKAKRLYDLSCHPKGESFFAAYKRLNSLLNDLGDQPSQWDPEKLCHETEKSLQLFLDQPLPQSMPHLLDVLEQWSAGLTAFFDEVKVVDPGYQPFRLALLHKIQQHFLCWDISPSLYNYGTSDEGKRQEIIFSNRSREQGGDPSSVTG